jgi:hypothetical protein
MGGIYLHHGNKHRHLVPLYRLNNFTDFKDFITLWPAICTEFAKSVIHSCGVEVFVQFCHR